MNVGQLTSKCLNLLTSLCSKYDDLKNVSKIHQIHASIEEVKIGMQENVRTALENSVSLERVQSQTGGLYIQSHTNYLRTLTAHLT